jgi:hypothetical protein
MLRIGSWIGSIFTAVLASLGAESVQPSRAYAQNIPNPSCAKAASDFVCVGALDGTTTQQIIVGNWGQQVGTAGWVIIIENTGVLRKCIGWAGSSGGGCSSITIR